MATTRGRKALAEELVEAVATVLGSHPGHRVTHTTAVLHIRTDLDGGSVKRRTGVERPAELR